MAIILASQSPRRKQLLNQIGCSHITMASTVSEDNNADLMPAELVVYHATLKALEIAARCKSDDVIIGADTIVVLDGKVFGKPKDDSEATYMLTQLSGRTHRVISGVTVVADGCVYSDSQETNVKIRSLSKEEIEHYVETGEPMDKAGAYAIQGIGALLVEYIQGCYTNVVGLPLVTLNRLISQAGVRLL